MFIEEVIMKYEEKRIKMNEVLNDRDMIHSSDRYVHEEKKKIYECILKDLEELQRVGKEKEAKTVLYEHEQKIKRMNSKDKFDELLLDVYMDLAERQTDTNRVVLDGMRELKAENVRLKGLIS